MNWKDKLLPIIKMFQGVSSLITSLFAIILTTIDDDKGRELKDKLLLPIQIVAFVCVGLYVILWIVIPWIIRRVKWAKWKIKYGIDIKKLDEFYESVKDKKVKEMLDIVKEKTEDKKIKELITEIEKEGVVGENKV